jgi:hypothetical protein
VAFGGVLALAAAVAVFWFYMELPRPVCHFRELTDIPCPTCGSTRLVEALLRFDVGEALRWNPLVFLGFSAAAVWAAASAARHLVGWPSWRVVFEARERWVLRVAAALTLVANWIYVVWSGV